MPTPNPEQTASVFSLLLYNFLNPLISKAAPMVHLPYDELPPLADSDHSKVLKDRTFKVRTLPMRRVLLTDS